MNLFKLQIDIDFVWLFARGHVFNPQLLYNDRDANDSLTFAVNNQYQLLFRKYCSQNDQYKEEEEIRYMPIYHSMQKRHINELLFKISRA